MFGTFSKYLVLVIAFVLGASHSVYADYSWGWSHEPESVSQPLVDPDGWSLVTVSGRVMARGWIQNSGPPTAGYSQILAQAHLPESDKIQVRGVTLWARVISQQYKQGMFLRWYGISTTGTVWQLWDDYRGRQVVVEARAYENKWVFTSNTNSKLKQQGLKLYRVVWLARVVQVSK